MDLGTIATELNKKFVYSEKIISTVINAIKYKRHCLLWGPPGHAKSDIVESCLRMLLGDEKFFEEVVLLNGGVDMDTAPITGYLDLAKFREGRRETILSETIFAKHKYAVIEEGLDIPAYALMFAKNPLTQGYLCVNNQCLTNKLETLFLCTNHDPRAWAKNDAEKAFIARFDFVIEVKWPAYLPENYEDLFLRRTGSSNRLVAKMVAANDSGQTSPRDAMKMLNLYLQHGDHTLLESFNGMTPKWYESIEKIALEAPFYKQLEELEAGLLLTEDDGNYARLKTLKTLLNFKRVPTDTEFTARIQKARQNYHVLAEFALGQLKSVTL